MDVDGARSEVVKDEELLDFADANDCALEHLLDKDAFLRVHDLVVALLELAVDLDVLDVEHCVMREPFFKTPKFTILDKRRNRKVRRERDTKFKPLKFELIVPEHTRATERAGTAKWREAID